jgi:hypothetical protein
MFFVRLLLGLRCLWSIVKTGNIDVALRDQLGLVRISTDPDVNEDRGPVPASEERVSGALQVLRILQEGSGLIDFLTEDLNQYSDQQLAHGVRGMQPQARGSIRWSRRPRASCRISPKSPRSAWPTAVYVSKDARSILKPSMKGASCIAVGVPAKSA